MSFTIPTAVHLMQADWDVDARARGAWTEGQWSTRNTKAQGSLPLSGANATGFVNTSATARQGVWWEFLASGGYDVSSETKLMIFNWQFNAPNRLEIDTHANYGIEVRIGSGTGSGPTDYKRYAIAGRDTVGGQARENPKMVVIDLNDTSEEAEVGTFDNTDVECMGFGAKTLNMGGSTTQTFLQRLFILDTTKGATNIPRFTGASSDWDDIITALGSTYTTKISDEWLFREGTIFTVASPIEIGDNSTATTFNDNGVSVFWPNSNDAADPRVRVTDQAFRVYLNLRNNAADTATFSGYYDVGDSNPPWDFDQDDAAVVTFNNPTFVNTGQFDLGSSVTGPATWNKCGVVVCQDNGVDIDGSTFRNPSGDHLLELAA